MINEDVNKFRNIFRIYTNNWKWILLTIFVFLTIGYFYQRYVTKIYNAKATILVNDYRRAGFNSEISAFSDKFSLYNQNKVSIDNEMEIIKSREIVEQAINNLGLNISYFSDGNLKSLNMYGTCPIRLVKLDSLPIKDSFQLKITIKGNIGCEVNNGIDGNQLRYNFDEQFWLNNNSYMIVKNSNYTLSNINDVFINITPLNYLVDSYKYRILTENIGKETSLCEISFSDESAERAIDFLKELIKVYEVFTIKQKKEQIAQTYKFVNERINNIDELLSNVENDGVSFKNINSIVDIDIESGVTISNKNNYQTKLDENRSYIAAIDKFIKDYDNSKVAYFPSNILPKNQILMDQILRFNDDFTEFNKMLRGYTKENSEYLDGERKLLAQKKSIINGMKNYQNLLVDENRIYGAYMDQIDSKLKKIPIQDKEITRNKRKMDIISDIYKYLMNKKEETAISLYSISPNSKTIEIPHSTFVPIYPSKKIVFLVSLLAGLLLSILTIYIVSLLDTRIKYKKDVTDRLGINYGGDISHSNENKISIKSRSSAAESFRIVRANIDFILNTKSSIKNSDIQKAKKIFVTSTISKEGKTFVGFNLAQSYAQINKKVLLIGLDVRNPKIDNYETEINASFGVTNYVSQNELDISKYLQKNK